MKIDAECLTLYSALNKLIGIRTTESCCGHDKQPYRFWLKVDCLEGLGLRLLLRCIDERYGATVPWKLYLEETDLEEDPITFILEGPIDCYEEANALALRLEKPNEGDLAWIKAVDDRGKRAYASKIQQEKRKERNAAG